MCYAGETSHDVQIRTNVNKSMYKKKNAAEVVVSGQGFYFCIVLGFISHRETVVLALYFVDESI